MNETKPKRKKKELASELLSQAPEVLQFAENCDVTAFRRWLLTNPTKPLICIGNGGKHTSYPALMYEMNAGVAKSITPLEFASMSPKTIASSKVLLLSNAGKNIDIGYAVKRAAAHNPENTAAFTFTDNEEENQLIKALKGHNTFIYKNHFIDGFISIRSKIFTYGLLYKAFSGKDKFVHRLNFEPRYDYFINKEGELPELKNIKHFVLLYGSYGEPVAHDIESTMVEGGIASVQVCDYRNFCHGRFIFAGNHSQSKRVPATDVCAILLTTPREAKIADYLRAKALASNMPIVHIHTDLNSSLATIQLLINSLHFVCDLAENHCGINPNSPPNYSDVDKRYPMNQVLFSQSLKTHGELTHNE